LWEHRRESEWSETLAEADCGGDEHDHKLAHSAPVLYGESCQLGFLVRGKDGQARTRGSWGSLDG
jgi:hypothetical protein